MSVGGEAMEKEVDLEASGEDGDDEAVDHISPRQGNRHSYGRTSEGGAKRFPCDRCIAVVGTQKSLNRHVKLTHSMREKRGQFACYCCNKQFFHKSKLLQHIKGHPAEQSYKCKTCGKISKTRHCLQVHMKIHDSNREKNFVCTICSKAFSVSQNLARHLVTHRSDRPFKCPQCPQRFKLLSILRKHLVVHSEQKPFQCELCEKSFKRSFDLEKHIRVHTGERPYSCHICKKAFKQSSDLNCHVRTHRGEERKIHQVII